MYQIKKKIKLFLTNKLNTFNSFALLLEDNLYT